jgi:hypothetical protein
MQHLHSSEVRLLAVVQIADFGLSRQLKAQTISTATYGTVRVDSPSCLPGSSTQAMLPGSCSVAESHPHFQSRSPSLAEKCVLRWRCPRVTML